MFQRFLQLQAHRIHRVVLVYQLCFILFLRDDLFLGVLGCDGLRDYLLFKDGSDLIEKFKPLLEVVVALCRLDIIVAVPRDK